MENMNIKDTVLFSEVAKVIGEDLALVELDCLGLVRPPVWDNSLDSAFIWGGSSRGHKFWEVINSGLIPPELWDEASGSSDSKTPCEKLGYKVGQKFRATGGDYVGHVLTLLEDDGTTLPLFKLPEGVYVEYLSNVEPMPESDGQDLNIIVNLIKGLEVTLSVDSEGEISLWDKHLEKDIWVFGEEWLETYLTKKRDWLNAVK